MWDATASDLVRVTVGDSPDPFGAVRPDDTAWAAVTTTGPPAPDSLADLYRLHYRPLVRMAALLIAHLAAAEEVVQEAFAAVHSSKRRTGDSSKAVAYMRRYVIVRSRYVQNYWVVPERSPSPQQGIPRAGGGLGAHPELSQVLPALHQLSRRQREVVVLRYYMDLPDAQIATAMGISRRAVKAETARAVLALRGVLGRGV